MAAASENAENSEENNPVNETELEVSDVDNNKIRLEGLKVVDLKNELEKRNLDKNGVKAVLIERLKSAIEKEGGNLEEYNFETSPDSTKSPSKKEKEGGNPEEYNFETSHSDKSPLKKEVESIETNGNIDTSDKLSMHEEKIDLALQLSLDEEEAQLNEEESFIDLTKHSENEIKVDDGVQPENDLSTSEKSPISEQSKPNVTPTKVLKSIEDTKKKSSKSILDNVNEGLSSPATLTIKRNVGKKEKLKCPNNMARCLWITGIPDTTRAADLKTLFSKQGRVVAVKVIKNAKQKPSKCYGFVTMSTSKDASKAIQNLHRTEFNGHTISVDKAKNEPGTLLKKSEMSQVFFGAKKPSSIKKEIVTPKKVVVVEKESKTEGKEASKEESKTVVSKPSTEDSVKKKDEKSNATDKEKSKDKDRKSREHREREKDAHRPIRRPTSFKPRMFSYDKPHYGGYKQPFSRRPFASHRVGFGSSFRPRPSLVDLQKMREERYQRERFRERREAEHRRADEISRHRYIERKQREEAYRLEREKEKLRIERELLEKERTEILKMEREKHRLERERIEREREELRRQAELRRGIKRPFSRIERESDPLWEERKKPTRYDGRTSFHSEASSSSRFEFPSRDRGSYIRDYERPPERFSSQKQMETLHRADFDREARREVTIRSREDRRVFSRNDFRGRDNRRSFSSRERERHLSSRRETSRDEWKHDRRVHERIISPSNTSTQRRMTYY